MFLNRWCEAWCVFAVPPLFVDAEFVFLGAPAVAFVFADNVSGFVDDAHFVVVVCVCERCRLWFFVGKLGRGGLEREMEERRRG